MRRYSTHQRTDDRMSGGKLYSTESGQLFHAGKIAIVLVGLPARGKTHLSVSLCRYLRWLGLSCKAFHLGDYRRKHLDGAELPDDYFFVNDRVTPSTISLRDRVSKDCKADIFKFYNDPETKGQVAIYDAVNASEAVRREINRDFSSKGIQVIFIESVCTDSAIISNNVRNVKVSSPDYAGWDPKSAVEDYLRRINAKIPNYEEMTREREGDLAWVKMINIGERMVVNKGTANIPTKGAISGGQGNFGYLGSRIVFFLMNLHVKPRVLYFARAGKSADASYKSDAPLLEPEGKDYVPALAEALYKKRSEERQKLEALDPSIVPEERSLTAWVSPRQRTVDSAASLKERGCVVRRRPQLTALNPGVYDTMSLEEIRQKYPGEAEAHDAEPFLHRFPRAESYHDVAIRLEPVILEIERERNDLVIIAHESILKVLYAYFMGVDSRDIPGLTLPRNEIIEVIPSSYSCVKEVIQIPGVAP